MLLLTQSLRSKVKTKSGNSLFFGSHPHLPSTSSHQQPSIPFKHNHMAVKAMSPHKFRPIREHADAVHEDMKMWRVAGMQKEGKTLRRLSVKSQHATLQSFRADDDDKARVVSDLCVIGPKAHTFNERNKESQTKQLNLTAVKPTRLGNSA